MHPILQSGDREKPQPKTLNPNLGGSKPELLKFAGFGLSLESRFKGLK